MEISRQEHGRSFRSSRFTNSEQAINYNPWNKRFSPIDPDYQPEMPHFVRKTQRGPHPYNRNHSGQRSQQASSSSNNIPSLLNLEIPPQPLLLPHDVEPVRTDFANLDRQLEPEPYDDYDDSSPAVDVEHMTEEEYLREEYKTKQQIEEIIAVAQALREKLDREEELRRQADQSIPKLMDLKPKIPSLLEIYVPPPNIQEETCWNCNCPGHRFNHCNMPRQRKFCYRCGAPGFDVASCRSCT
ncbi:uncharacterized protein LOC131671265 [Phymastichus coffea]|uniref:uncharacterized protein LOC131671265 n=1 Tax=Phymastichus coffea TaxID=108790 RepID=UPI00273AC18A|nr:uncharacterized protein LOC131671265 [Phymastichus coffea]